MCGLVGYVGFRHASTERAGNERLVSAMAAAIASRGPDDSGCWVDPTVEVALAHRRLAIVDLSPMGHQPMLSADSRYVLVFNGEIYNHHDLRAELAGHHDTWRGESDTETLLAAIVRWGLADALRRAQGMFAVALWDRATRTLSLARDRLGEKPLYYGWQAGTLLIGSELKALRVHPAFEGRIDPGALALQQRHGYIAAPYTIYDGIRKLLPGHVLTIRPGQTSSMPVAYWSAQDAAVAGQAAPFPGSAEEATEHLEVLLKRSIAQQMVADVPLGAFLSGGIDSSTVVALMQAQSDRQVRTFSIGFGDTQYNEAHHARAVAEHLGTLHTELYVTPNQALAVIPELPTIYDEPFSDASQIPTLILSRLARDHVTVALSGDGGDELFYGYRRYVDTDNLWRKLRTIPALGRRMVAASIRAVPPPVWNLLTLAHTPRLGDKLHKGAVLLSANAADELYLRLISAWQPEDGLLRDGAWAHPTDLDRIRADMVPDLRSRLMLHDLLTYLPDDILTKVDRAAMATSLETRVPLLDHRIVEFALSLPPELRVRDGVQKWPLRQVLYRHVPRKLIERPKMGFGVPLESWLRGPLKPWAEDILASTALGDHFTPEVVRRRWEEHQSGVRNWSVQLWNVLMFSAWLDQSSVHQGVSASIPSLAAIA